MEAPLYQKLKQYSQVKKPFHMPGHKFGAIAPFPAEQVFHLDATEAADLDNLYEAKGIIKESMKLMAKFYNAKETLFLTNGSTSGILASILAICKPGDQLVVPRNCHYSVWNALILGGVTPIYIQPTLNEMTGAMAEVEPNSIKEALEKYPKVKGAIVVSPTYEGMTSDIKSIASILNKYDKVLIVDEAHGSHFVLNSIYPESSITLGADIVIHSMHKTMPALTQSALLHLCTDKVGYEQLINALKMVQTSSPSYVMMANMDYIRAYLLEGGAQYVMSYIKNIKNTRHKLIQELKKIHILDEETSRYDISKIIISTKNTDIDGYQLALLLEKEYDIIVEAAMPSYIILISTIADSKEHLDELVQALIEIDYHVKTSTKQIVSDSMRLNMNAVLGNNIREIYYSAKEEIILEEAVGRIATKNIMLYPPGIPILSIGECITQFHIDKIIHYKDKVIGIRVRGTIISIEVGK